MLVTRFAEYGLFHRVRFISICGIDLVKHLLVFLMFNKCLSRQ